MSFLKKLPKHALIILLIVLAGHICLSVGAGEFLTVTSTGWLLIGEFCIITGSGTAGLSEVIDGAS